MRYFDLLKEAEGDDNDRNLARLNFITDYLKRNPQTMNQLHKQLKQRERDEKVAAGDPDANDIKAKLNPKVTAPEKDQAPLIKNFIEAMVQAEGDDDDMIEFVNNYGKVSYIDTKAVRTEGERMSFDSWLSGKGKVSDSFIRSLFLRLFSKDAYGGPGETAMALLSPQITRPEGNKGDLVIDGVKVEVKGEDSKGGGRLKDENTSISTPNVDPIYKQVIEKNPEIEDQLPPYARISTNSSGREITTAKGPKFQLLNVAKRIDAVDKQLADDFMKEMLAGSFTKVADKYNDLFANWRNMNFQQINYAAAKMSYLNYKTELDAKGFDHILLLNRQKSTSLYFNTNKFDDVRELFRLGSVDFGDKINAAAAQISL